MRVAIPVTAGTIPNHLGHCESFLLAEVEDGRVVREELVPNPGHGPDGPPPAFLAHRGVTHVLAWGCPPAAQDMFASVDIQVSLGATGPAREALVRWLAGTLVPVTAGVDAGGGCGASPLDHGRPRGGCAGGERGAH
jgi:predicted Fe-Mo cluster-binding NifX family protein